MASVNDRIVALVETFTAATTALDVEVVDSWTAANESGTVLTVGVPDTGLRDIGSLTRPAWRFDQAPPDGWGEAPQMESLSIFCQVEIAPLGDVPDPTEVRAAYDDLIATCRASLSARELGVQRVWLSEGEGFQADSPSGWRLFGTFQVVLVSIIG